MPPMATPTIPERIFEDTKVAMKARRPAEVSALRMLAAALKNKRIELGHDLTDDEAIAVLTTEAKKRRESVEAYRGAGRTELADKEEAELAVLARYLPQPLTDDEARAIVAEVVAEVGATSPQDLGKVMGKVMGRVKGRFDGGRVKDLVLERLQG